MGFAALYTDNLWLDAVKVTRSNYFGEFKYSPQTGALLEPLVNAAARRDIRLLSSTRRTRAGSGNGRSCRRSSTAA